VLPTLDDADVVLERRDEENLLRQLVAGADTGLLVPFARSLTSWRSTAEVWSDPQLARGLQGPFPGDGGEAVRPSGEAA
jgi:hypothetical protein